MIDSQLITINRENIVKSLGVPLNQADAYLYDQIEEQINHCLEICTPRGCYSVFREPVFLSGPGDMLLNGKTFHLKRIVASALSKSSEIATFACTCGEEVEIYSKKLMSEGNSIEGLIANLVGSEIAETVAGYIHQKIQETMAIKGLKTTNRYSPGYCQWNVSEQQQLFALLDKNNCGIYLTDSSLMIPLKSVSGIIGIGKNVKNQGYTCSKCDAEYCLYRDKKT